MALKVKILLVLFALSYVAYHLFTLSLNPLPWFDEVFFVSITKSFSESGKFIPQVSKEMWNGEEIFYHGPVYYLLESTSYKVFGFSVFTFRWMTFVFGILTMIASAVLFRYFHSSSRLFWLLAITFALDPFMNLSLHEGRMDLIAIFYMLLSSIFLLKGMKEEKPGHFFISGLFAAIALLTTPRVAIVFIAVGIVFLLSLEGKALKRSLQKIVWWSAPVFLLYSAWAFYAFGGYIGLFQYYQNLRQTTAEYVGGKLYIPKHEYLLIVLTAISVIIGIIKKRLLYFNEGVIISFLSIAFFYMLVLDWGPYSVLILPFYYFLLFHGIRDVAFSWKNGSLYPFLLIFLFNLSFFAVKSMQVLAEADIKKPQIADEFVRNNIPRGSKVIGGAEFYYSVIKAGSDYRLYDQFLSDATRERLLREEYDYDYFIVTSRSKEKDPDKVSFFMKQAEFKKVAELKMERNLWSKKIDALGLVSNAEKNGYNAEIYVRIKDQKNPMAVK